MTAELPDELEVGWVVTDPDGNVVQRGGISKAYAVAWLGELLEQAGQSEEPTEGVQ